MSVDAGARRKWINDHVFFLKGRLLTWLLRQKLSWDDSEDLLAMMLEDLLSTDRDLENVKDPLTYLKTVLRNKLVDLARSPQFCVEDCTDADSIQSEAPSPEREVDCSRVFHTVVAAMRDLPEQQYRALTLLILGFTKKEISKRMRIDLGTAKVHLRRGRKALKGFLPEGFF